MGHDGLGKKKIVVIGGCNVPSIGRPSFTVVDHSAEDEMGGVRANSIMLENPDHSHWLVS